MQKVADLVAEILEIAHRKREIKREISEIEASLRRFVELETKRLVKERLEKKLRRTEIEEAIDIRIPLPKKKPRVVVVVSNKYCGSAGRFEFDFDIDLKEGVYEKLDEYQKPLAFVDAFMTVLEHRDEIVQELEKFLEKSKKELEEIAKVYQKAKERAAKVLVAKNI